jgi:hypothetical protein
VAKEKGLLTIGVVTIPFYFEHRRKIIKALKGVDELRKNVDALLIVNNERLCDIYSDTNISLKNALAEADNVLKNAVKGISELITISSEGNINLDFRDVETTMRNGGGAIMAIGRAKGDHRVERAIIDALDSPLLHGNDISRAKRILFNIYASEDFPVDITKAENLVAARVAKTSLLVPNNGNNYAVTAVNRYGIESTPAQLLLNAGKHYAAPTISKTDGRPIALPSKGAVLDAEFVVIETLDGRQVALRPYSAVLSVNDLPNGIYQIRSLGKKGRNHRIGFFSIKR